MSDSFLKFRPAGLPFKTDGIKLSYLVITVSGLTEDKTSGPMTFLVSCNMDARVVVTTL